MVKKVHFSVRLFAMVLSVLMVLFLSGDLAVYASESDDSQKIITSEDFDHLEGIALLSEGDSSANGEAGILSNFECILDEENRTVTLTKYTGTDTVVEVPASYEIDGSVYQTSIDSRSCFCKNTTITAVTINEGVKFKDNSMYVLFGGCTKLASVDLTKLNTAGVTDMAWVFYQCSSLTSLDLSSFDTSAVTTMKGMFSHCANLKEITGLENFNTSSLLSIYVMFNRTNSLEKVDLSRWDLDQLENSGWCFQICGAKEILLPDNIAVLSAGFFNHASAYEGSSFTIPAGVKKIGYAHTFYDFATSDFTEFKVAEGNEKYVAIDGVLYSTDGTEIVAVPRAKTFEDGAYEIQEGVTFIPELSFSRNSNITSVTLPNSYVIRQFVPAEDPQYIIFEDDGNLNAANSLTIAFYVYTGVTEYAVKDDNPLYSSDRGIIYSKDMTTLVAVPARYDQLMNIPDGVTTWNTYAMWPIGTSSVDGCMVNCEGVYIPATLTDIAQDQIDMLNRLNGYRLDGKSVNGTAYTFKITVAEENPAYKTDENGYLVKKVIIASGTCGGVSWTIDSEGNMLFYPTNGVSGTLEKINAGSWPWKDYMAEIKTISFKETVYAAANSQYLFYGLENLESIVFDGFDTSNVTSMFAMFCGDTSLKSLDMSRLDTSKVTSLRSTFEGCTSLSSVNVTGWNTGNVTTMYCMFWDCGALKELDLSGFKTPKLTNIAGMFRYCYELEKLDISNFDFSAVTRMEFMFFSNRELASLKLPAETDTSKVTNMSYMFYGCESLTELDLSGWKQSGKLNTIGSMFMLCKSLTTLDISSLDVTNCKFFEDYFQNCDQLQTITLGENFNFLKDQYSFGWPAGIWYYEGTNTAYTGQNLNATDITALLEKGSLAGTFKKVGNHSIQAGFSVDYKINRISRDAVTMTSTSDLFVMDEDYRVYMLVDGSSLTEATYKVPGSFTMTFANSVTDASGKTYDLQMEYNNITLHEAKSIYYSSGKKTYYQYYHYLFQLTDSGIASVTSLDTYTRKSIINPSVQPTSEYDITLTILDEDGNPVEGSFVFSIYDVDIPSTMDYGQPGTKNSPQYANEAYGYYSEGVYLKENDFDLDTITLADNTYLWEVGNTEKGYRITGTQVDDASELSDLIVQADASGATFTWTGWRCEDFILYNYQPDAVQIQKTNEAEMLISGANMQLYQYSAGEWKMIADWTSSSAASHNIFLAPGQYKLVEVASPDNYYVAEEIVFIVNMDYEICDVDGNVLETSPILRMTNVHYPISISGDKTWEDGHNAAGKRPESITINLLADGVKIDSRIVTAKDGWKWIFDNLPKYADGKEIVYTISEEEVIGYTSTIAGYDVINRYIVEKPDLIRLMVKKVWADKDDKDEMRPDSITVTLYNGNIAVENVILNENNNWMYIWTDLDADGDWRVEETSVHTGYSASYQTSNGIVTITNTYLEVPDTGDDVNVSLYAMLLFASASALMLLSFAIARKKSAA